MSTQKIAYEVNGEIVYNLKELSQILGEKVTRKDIEEGKWSDAVAIVDLSEEDMSDEEWENSAKAQPKQEKHPMEVKDSVEPGEVYTALSEEDMKNLENVDPEEIKASFPEFESLDELKEFIKDIDTPTLEYIATGLGLEWTPTYHKNIHRMRVAMALHRHFFPELFQPKESKKKKAKYGDYDTETLFAMAEEQGIEVKKSGNEPIDRMRVIMKLKDKGVLPE